MAFLQIKSTNPKMSYVLGKNPASGMMIRSIRRGKAFAWYSDDQTYNLWFKDSETEVSYKSHPNEEFEHVNTTRFNSSMAILNLLGEFFNKTVKETEENDKEGFVNEVTINMLKISSERILRLTEYMTDFDVKTEELSVNNYRINIITSKTMRELLNFVNLFCLYAALKNSRDYIDINKDTIEKYFNCLEVVDPPYFVRYIFKINVLHSRNKFDKYKTVLETTKQHKEVKLTFGDTSLARRDWLKTNMGSPEKDIVDVGCGEGFYAFDLAKKLKENTYYAVDIDEEVRELVKKKAAKRKVENITVCGNHNALGSFEGKDVLFVEVMEHMPYEEALKLGKELISKNPDRLFITTPNKEFNKYYFEDGRFRHDDHEFELTYEEFFKYIDDINIEGRYDVSFHDVGDTVDCVATTVGAVLVRRTNYEN